MILVIVSACQMTSVPQDADALPTVAGFPTETPTLTPTLPLVIESATFTPSPTIATPTETPVPSETPSPTVPSVILLPSRTPTPPPPAITRTPLPSTFIFGKSAGGRDLLAYRFGGGRKWIMLVGGIHAGFEANTISLMERFRIHFQNNAGEILPDVSFIIIPRLNPDGEQRGRILEGRFNGNGVDLNRNWACGWEETAEFDGRPVDPGLAPFDQPESAALASLIQETMPDAVLFYHAAANGVYAGTCGENPEFSMPMAEVYGTASQYPFGDGFNSYPVTGSAPAWVNSIGIPSAEIELASAEVVEFDRNLQGLQALQRWIASR